MVNFDIILLDEASEFIDSLPTNVADKIYYNMKRVADGEFSGKLFEKLGDSNIWEFRTSYNKMTYRLFAFWDTTRKRLVVATHGLVKKTQKTPLKEIRKAEKIRLEYFKDK